jgi:hypothetical protein
MYIPFEEMPGHSKIWIFQSDKELSSQQEHFIKQSLKVFIEQWTAHQHSLKASFEILHHYFIIIAVDESHNDASGCSIDKVFITVKQIGSNSGIDFFNRMNIVTKIQDTVKLYHPDQLINQKTINTDETLVFNNLIDRKGDLETNWLIPIQQSWVANRFNALNNKS